jgi:hypothetical protein
VGLNVLTLAFADFAVTPTASGSSTRRLRADSAGATDLSLENYAKGAPIHPERTEWRIGVPLSRAGRLTREQAVFPGWRLLLDVMRTLAGPRGSENVRPVIWFDGQLSPIGSAWTGNQEPMCHSREAAVSYRSRG